MLYWESVFQKQELKLLLLPFTFSHPAIILPLNYLPKGWFSLTGLVIGSIVPDFEYFIRMRILSVYSHTLEGLFWFDLPLGLLLAFLFHNIVRDPLIDKSPAFLKARFLGFQYFSWNMYFKKNWLVVVFSILIGAASHVLWDSFTHPGGYFVERIPVLSNMLLFGGYRIPVLKILQHASTIVGGLVIWYTIWKLPVAKKVSKEKYAVYWMVVGICAFAIVAFRLLTGLDYRAYGNVIVTAIAGGMVALVLVSLWKMRRQKSDS